MCSTVRTSCGKSSFPPPRRAQPASRVQISVSLHPSLSPDLDLSICIFCSGTQLGPDGWGAVLEAAERLKALTAVEPLGPAWGEVREGRLLALDLNDRRDQGLVVACVTRYLWWSASCLTSIDIRRPAFHSHCRVCVCVGACLCERARALVCV